LATTESSVTGYGPSLLIHSGNLTAKQFTVSSSYINNGVSLDVVDYSYSTAFDYPGTYNDGGLSLFGVGYKCQFNVRDIDPFRSGSLTIASISGSTITFVESIPDPDNNLIAMALSGNLALRFDAFSTTMPAAQQLYAYVGNEDSLRINNTTVYNKRFSS
jgi:hypothetical protein